MLSIFYITPICSRFSFMNNNMVAIIKCVYKCESSTTQGFIAVQCSTRLQDHTSTNTCIFCIYLFQNVKTLFSLSVAADDVPIYQSQDMVYRGERIHMFMHFKKKCESIFGSLFRSISFLKIIVLFFLKKEKKSLGPFYRKI